MSDQPAALPQHRTVRLLMWQITSPLADLLFTISHVVLIVGAVATLIGTIGFFVMSGVREQFANERISANEAATAQANAASNVAKAQAAQAQAEAAKAQADAAKAQLELARLKAPRSLTPEQQQQLITAVNPFPASNMQCLSLPTMRLRISCA